MKRFKLFLPLIIFVLFVGFFFMLELQIKEGEYDPKAMPSALVGRSIPEFAVADLFSGEIITKQHLLGQVALINVWATWCPSCYIEHPYLNQLAQQQVVIYGVDYKDDREDAKQWLSSKGDPYRYNIFDKTGILGLDLGVTGAPETYVIDHRGVVHLRHQGPLNEKVWQERFLPLITRLQQIQTAEGS